MVRDLERTRSTSPFPASAPAANSVFYRTYSRRGLKDSNLRETWGDVGDRVLQGLIELGKLTREEVSLIERMQHELKSLTSGRWLWVGGTNWIRKPENYSGAYNCTSTNVTDWRSFGLMMDLAMMGSGTGAVIEPKYISQLPRIRNQLEVKLKGEIGTTPKEQRRDRTTVNISGNQVEMIVGDSRQGWVSSYQTLLELSSDDRFTDTVQVSIDLSDVRPAGETLSGFGGVANPVRLPGLYERCAKILNRASASQTGGSGRQLTSVECCLLIDEAAVTIVAGNIRRSAGMRQGSSEDAAFAGAKENLWQQDSDGNWRIDPDRDSLRMANHTRVFHRKPTLEECTEAVRKQYYSGEGAIQWAGEAIARSNRDILNTPELKAEFLKAYSAGKGEAWLQQQLPFAPQDELLHRIGRYGLNPCGEILGENFHCNLSEIHLNQLDPSDRQSQIDAFRAGALSVAVLLHHRFQEPRYQYSRELDPIVGVSFTGLFDFFVHAFGSEWLEWWRDGRPRYEWAGEKPGWFIKGKRLMTALGLEDKPLSWAEATDMFVQVEQEYLNFWRDIVHEAVWEYCDREGLKRPNRCTTVQPAGTKSLLTGASAGWHPPKAQRFIRRITFRKNDPVALACLDYGYSIVPSQSDKDEQGNLLNDPFDPRCTEWLVEIPVEVPWANLPGADEIAIEQFSALAQMDFYMQVQKHYTTHNTSATIELREDEIDALANRIYQAIEQDEGYISAALLARFDAPFPRLPFEKIDRATYVRLQNEVRSRQQTDNFYAALARYDSGETVVEGPAGCDSDKCMMPEKKGD